MSEFSIYLTLGFEHIADINGYDHILFIIALAAIYQFSDWKKVLVLVTAFTIGHSITLALATLNIVNVDSTWIEFLIPATILLTSIFNYFQSDKPSSFSQSRYLTALVFGLIHGLGFSNYLRSLLGQEENIFTPLLAFNVGLEIGQILIVFTILILTFIFSNILQVKRREWMLLLSGAAGGVAITMMMERMPF